MKTAVLGAAIFLAASLGTSKKMETKSSFRQPQQRQAAWPSYRIYNEVSDTTGPFDGPYTPAPSGSVAIYYRPVVINGELRYVMTSRAKP